MTNLSDRSSKRLDSVAEALTKNFASEAARKRAMEDLRSVYDEVKNAVMTEILNRMGPREHDENFREIMTPEQEVLNELYWSFPDFQHVKPATFEKFAGYPLMNVLEEIVQLRVAVKTMEVVKYEKPIEQVRVERVQKSLAEQMQYRKEAFERGVELTHMFKRQGISVRGHYVIGHKGTIFPRFFYYLHGKLTALNTILAVAEETEEFMNEVYAEKERNKK